MVTPTDMGGYYQIEPAAGAAVFDSASCLAELRASPGQSGWAYTALIGPNLYGVPTIVETAVSYPGSSAASVYRALVETMSSKACTTFGFQFYGTAEKVPVTRFTIPAVGDSDSVWHGQFSLPGRTEEVQVGLVLHGRIVLNMVYVDTVPPSDPIMGSFVSTLSNAIGKLA